MNDPDSLGNGIGVGVWQHAVPEGEDVAGGGARLDAAPAPASAPLAQPRNFREVVALACADPADAADVIDAVSGRVDGGARVGEVAITPEDRLGMRADLLVEPHVVDLFDGTLREQLATRAPEQGPSPETGDDGWADAALHAAGAEDLLRILPEGYDTRILDRGANLSGGQRQRIALARAVAADAPVLVLHDPTTAVDAVTEQNIAEALVAALGRAGVPVVRGDGFSFDVANPTREQMQAMDRTVDVFKRGAPAVYVNGMGMSNPSAAQAIAEYRATRARR
mgnify:CR=1 FL=1